MENFKKPYLDSEKELFDKLFQEEKEKIISETGSEEGAIQQHGYELAMRSMDKKNKSYLLKKKSNLKDLRLGRKMLLSLFLLKDRRTTERVKICLL